MMISQSQQCPAPSNVSLAKSFMENSTDIAPRAIIKRVQEALRATGYFVTNPCDVTIRVSSDAHVTLSGSVVSYYLKQQAQVAALSVEGVRSLQNDLVVR